MKLFNWARQVKPYHLVVIVADDPDTSCVLANRALRICNFHQGNIWVGDADRYSAAFVYPASSGEPLLGPAAGSAKACKSTFEDIFKRQWGHALWTMSDDHAAKHRELLQKAAADAGRNRAAADFARSVRPAHHLPSTVFGASMPDAVYQAVNKYLCVPQSYLVLHHATSAPGPPSWAKRLAVQRCLTALDRPENKTLRIVAVRPDQLLSRTLLDKCSVLALFFRRDEKIEVLRKWHKQALATCFPDGARELLDALGSLAAGRGLVVDLEAVRRNPTSGPAHVYWTTQRATHLPAP